MFNASSCIISGSLSSRSCMPLWLEFFLLAVFQCCHITEFGVTGRLKVSVLTVGLEALKWAVASI